jgi:potassium-transporting ATPase ATP-binding subunit
VVRIGKAHIGGQQRAEVEGRTTARSDVMALLLDGSSKAASELLAGDVVVVEVGGLIPCDGCVIDGVAMVDESAITGESAPVLRESGSDRAAVIAGTRVLTRRIVVEV